jgi:hypothetical protein
VPDEEGRTKLTKLYAGGLDVSEQLLGEIVSRTKGATPAFIKELMRRCAQFQIELSPGNVLTEPAVDGAIEEMLFTGGALNRRLLGGGGVELGCELTRSRQADVQSMGGQESGGSTDPRRRDDVL